MKRIYLLTVLFVAFATGAFAQRTMDLTMTSHKVGPSSTSRHEIANGEKFLYDAGGLGVYYFSWTIKNLGPDSLKPGDTLKFKSAFGTNFVYEFPASGSGSSLKKDSSITIVPSANGGAITLSPNSSVVSSSTDPNIPWCDSGYAVKGPSNTAITLTNVANDKLCNTVEITWWVTGINTVTGQNDGFILYPNPASGKLNVKFDFGTGAKVAVLLRDITGKVVLNKDMGNMSGMSTFSLDVSNLTSGLYTAELFYGEQHIVSKINVQ
jgi:hypothetical protein